MGLWLPTGRATVGLTDVAEGEQTIMPDTRRLERLGSVIEQIVSEIVANDLRDPGIADIVSITRADVAQDLSTVRIAVSVMGDDEAQRLTIRALERAAGFVRRRLAGELSIRQTPEVIWTLDRSIERGDRVLALLNSLVIPPAPDDGIADASLSRREIRRQRDETQMVSHDDDRVRSDPRTVALSGVPDLATDGPLGDDDVEDPWDDTMLDGVEGDDVQSSPLPDTSVISEELSVPQGTPLRRRVLRVLSPRGLPYLRRPRRRPS